MKVLSIKTFRHFKVKIILLFPILLLILGCSQSNDSKQIEEIFKQTSKIEIYAHLVHYRWDENDSIAKKALWHNTLADIPEKYIRNKIVLTKDQTSKLKKNILSVNNEITDVMDCYEPRHLIIFYNKNNTILGHINICFSCSSARGSSNLSVFKERILFQNKLFREFGITYFFETNEETEAYNNKRKQEQLERDKKVAQ